MSAVELVQRYGPDALQGVGSLVVLGSSWVARRRLTRVVWTWDGHEAFAQELRAAVSGQFRDQAIGFGLFAVGFAIKLFWPA